MPRDRFSRRRVLQSLGTAASLALAGCNGATSAGTGTGTATRTESHTHTEGGMRTESAASSVGSVSPQGLHDRLTAETDVPDDRVRVGYHLQDDRLPLETEVYPAPADAAVHAMDTYDTTDLGDVGLVPDGADPLATVETDAADIHHTTTPVGEMPKVTLVARSSEPTMQFTAYHRTGHPYAGFDGTHLSVDCYCGGDVYTAPQDGTWARVIQLMPLEAVDPGTGVVLSWPSGRPM